MTRLTANEWSVYWEKGSVTTFQDIFQENYSGEIKSFWEKEFATLPQNAHLIDLACGNGALALLAGEYSAENECHFNVSAVDFAQIQRPTQLKNKQYWDAIDFYPQTQIENTPLAYSSVDFAMSQFGVEYGDPEASVNEISRILKPSSAKFCALVHRDDSVIVKQAKETLKSIAVCKESALPAVISSLQTRLDQVKQDGKDPAKDEQCEQLREELNKKMAELQDAAGKTTDPRHFEFFMRGCMAPFGQTAMRSKNLKERLGYLDMLDAEMKAVEIRMEDLVSAALSPSDLKKYEHFFSRHGFRCVQQEAFSFREGDFAYALVYER